MKKITKKALALFLLVLIMVSAVTFNASASDSNRLLGDGNQDSTVNIKDATAVQKHLADILKLSDTGLKLSDTDQNGTLNIKDATTIQKWLAGIKVNSPVGDPFDVSGTDTPEAKDIVTDAFSYTYTDIDETYTYNIPQINLKGADIARINAEIWEKYYEGSMKYVFYAIEAPESIVIYLIDYRWTVNDDILSLVIRQAFPSSCIYHNIYNISISTGEIISNEALIQQVGYTEAEYKARMKDVMACEYVSQYKDIIETYPQPFISYIQRTLSEDNLALSRPFINKKGELCIIGIKHSMAGAEIYEIEYNLDTCEIKQEYLDIVNNLLKY